MRKCLFLLVIFLPVSTILYAQAGVYLYINNITTGAATGVHADEAAITSLQHGSAVSVTFTNGIPSAGAPQLSEFVFTKSFDITTLRLQNLLLKSSLIAAAEIRYYNSQSILVYSITFENLFLTTQSASSDGSGCPSGCQSITESYSILPAKKVTYRNLAVTPNQILSYDIPTNKAIFTQ